MSYSQEKQIEHLLQDCLEEEEEDDVDLKICRVCMDKATGYHFNVMTCEGCKGFFRRAVKSNIRYSCPFQNSCVITKNSRRQCQACRLKRCLEIGMNKEMIMSDKAVEERRTLIKKNKTLKMTPSIPEEPDLTKEQEKLLEDLLEAHRKTFDASFTHFTQFRVGMPQVDLKSKSFTLYTMSLCCRTYSGIATNYFRTKHPDLEKDYKLQRNFSMLPHIADLATYMIQGTINFAKAIPFFRDLSVEDQISLLKGATFEICQIRFNTVFNVDTSIWECGQLKYSIEDATQSGFQQLLLEPLLNFHCTLRSLKLTDKEYVLMQAISLFSPDRADNSNNKAIELIQEKVAMTLKAIIDTKKTKTDKNNVHLSFRFLFPKIMLILTELRTLSAENNRQILEIQNIQPDVTPLMLEMFGEIG
uniref:Nuclear receptor subfamily 1, group I, member 2 n=1 Tax=Callorhinchus milii TaxID=7868 RepID=A0A4W3GEZ3_CALMI